MAAVQQSIEYQTLLKNERKLTDLFRTSISSFVDELYTNGLISQEVFETKTDNNADAKKAKEMTMCVLESVRKDLGKYSVFMSMKAFELPWAKFVHKDLTQDFDDIKIRLFDKAVEDKYADDLALNELALNELAPDGTTQAGSQDPPKITTHPTCDPKKHCKQELVLTLRATGFGTLEYQWIKDETPILTEDFLPNCKGVTSDSLEFTDLQTVHSGRYKCKVTSSLSGQSVESKSAELKVLATMNLAEFISECQDPMVTVSEDLEKHIKEYLQHSGDGDLKAKLKCPTPNFNFDEATINFEQQTKTYNAEALKQEINENPTSWSFLNTSKTKDIIEKVTEDVTYTEGLTTSKTTWSGWSFDGKVGLSLGFESCGVPIKPSATSGVEYKKGQSKTITQAKGTVRTKTFHKDIDVPKNTQVHVTVMKGVTVFNCSVTDLMVTFDTSDKVKISVDSKGKTNKKKIELKKIFENSIGDKDKVFTVLMHGNIEWSETSLYLRISDPMPLPKTKAT